MADGAQKEDRLQEDGKAQEDDRVQEDDRALQEAGPGRAVSGAASPDASYPLPGESGQTSGQGAGDGAGEQPGEALEADSGGDEAAGFAEGGSGVELDFGADASAMSSGGNLAAGAEVIRKFWRTLPGSPGVYRMIDANGEVLYVGKARNLKNRVANYTRGVGHGGARTARMIAATATMEFVTTRTETEALLLEANLIKQLRPRYNVLLRDDKSFPYILLTRDHRAPQILKHRGARNRPGDYYGPFANAGAVTRTLDALERAFLLRSCSDSYFENRTRPCLLFQIKRCSGPCTNEIPQQDYDALVAEARAFLSGRSTMVRERMAQDMQAASDNLEFEKAARYRDRLAALSAIQSSQEVNPRSVEEADVFGIAEQAGQFCIQAFFFRNGQNWGNVAYFPRADRSMSPGEVLESFIAQFYDDRPCPRLILTSVEPDERVLLADALSAKTGRAVELATPRRGEKRDLADHAARNAHEALSRRLSETASQQKLMEALAAAFGLPRPPRRIEVYDNSHIMGTNAVGGMIVAGVGGFAKTHYRTFNMRSEDLKPGDDYGMMKEMLRRRFARLMKEEPRQEAGATDPARVAGPPADAPQAIGAMLEDAAEEEADASAVPAWPDLVLVDGGRGQHEAAKAVFAELGVTDVALVAIAKGMDREAGRETFFMEGRAPFRLPPRDPALYFVQRMRDEAHRFAIGTHRARRKKDLVRSPLDEIPGVGPARKRALLLHFGTAKAVAAASLDDLARTPGVNAATARTVYAFFHDGAG
ncbi:UvrABC system protein C [Camelimonas fluminis]|uniref:UvrABC system protein C n=1 Tax=Camelimonas fluminis TaxID=1576911 RepID=A0ABV7UG76_9HYPH|nr:excinuclease ABC subunit UvrC [Camelimonas fluminis]GHE70368.1 UvrABC system protein C [Camelimonas fluminis]